MGSISSVENRFRERVKAERQDRGWSQADLAKRMQAVGMDHVLASTVAKIEAGDRAVRIEEASAFAELFDLPVDALIGRGHRNDPGYILRMITGTASQGDKQLSGIAATLSSLLEDAKSLEFDNQATLVADGQLALDLLQDAAQAMGLVARFELPPEVALRRPDDPTWLRETTEISRQFSRDMDINTRAALRERRGIQEDK